MFKAGEQVPVFSATKSCILKGALAVLQKLEKLQIIY